MKDKITSSTSLPILTWNIGCQLPHEIPLLRSAGLFFRNPTESEAAAIQIRCREDWQDLFDISFERWHYYSTIWQEVVDIQTLLGIVPLEEISSFIHYYRFRKIKEWYFEAHPQESYEKNDRENDRRCLERYLCWYIGNAVLLGIPNLMQTYGFFQENFDLKTDSDVYDLLDRFIRFLQVLYGNLSVRSFWKLENSRETDTRISRGILDPFAYLSEKKAFFDYFSNHQELDLFLKEKDHQRFFLRLFKRYQKGRINRESPCFYYYEMIEEIAHICGERSVTDFLYRQIADVDFTFFHDLKNYKKRAYLKERDVFEKISKTDLENLFRQVFWFYVTND